MKFSQKMPLYFFYTMVQKSQKWPKTQIKAGSCLNPSSFEKRAQNWLSFTLHAFQLETSDATLWCSWHRQTRLSLRNRWAWRHGNQPAQQCIVLMQSFRTGMRISLCITLQGWKPGLDTAASNRLANYNSWALSSVLTFRQFSLRDNHCRFCRVAKTFEEEAKEIKKKKVSKRILSNMQSICLWKMSLCIFCFISGQQ